METFYNCQVLKLKSMEQCLDTKWRQKEVQYLKILYGFDP